MSASRSRHQATTGRPVRSRGRTALLLFGLPLLLLALVFLSPSAPQSGQPSTYTSSGGTSSGGALESAWDLLPSAWAKDKIWDSEENNLTLTILDSSGSNWEWLTYKPEWKKRGIVKAARRVLTKLKDGTAPTGQGALLFLAIRKADEDDKLEELIEDDDLRGFLLKRFGSDEPEVEVEKTTVLSATDNQGHPAYVLRAEGMAPNMSGNKAKCLGAMLVTVCKGKLYLLSMYGFPTEFDEEGVSVDLDYMEGSALELNNTKGASSKGARPPPVEDPEQNEGEGGEEPAEEKERTEDEMIEHREQKWRITIDKKLLRAELNEEEDAENLVLKIEHNDINGGVMLYMYAPQTTQYVDGVKAAPPNLKKWITTSWWNTFTTTHPEGDLFTYKWPKKPEGKNPTFLTVPDLTSEKARVGVVTGKKKRPVEVSQSDATKKLKFAGGPKKNNIGKKGKGGEAMRGILEGKRPRVGKETVLRYAWRSPSHSYRLFVIFTRDGYKKYGAPIRRTLESLEFVKKFKKERK